MEAQALRAARIGCGGRTARRQPIDPVAEVEPGSGCSSTATSLPPSEPRPPHWASSARGRDRRDRGGSGNRGLPAVFDSLAFCSRSGAAMSSKSGANVSRFLVFGCTLARRGRRRDFEPASGFFGKRARPIRRDRRDRPRRLPPGRSRPDCGRLDTQRNAQPGPRAAGPLRRAAKLAREVGRCVQVAHSGVVGCPDRRRRPLPRRQNAI